MITPLWLIGSGAIGVIGAWLAGRMMQGNGFGLAGNTVAGVLGAVVGGFLLRMGGADLGGSLPGRLVVSFVGAAIVLSFVYAFTGRRGGRRSWS